MRAKAFMQVGIGALALAGAYHLGATSAKAQAPGNPVVASIPCGVTVVTSNGDVYTNSDSPCPPGAWQRVGNVFVNGPTPARATSFGELKARYR